MVSNKEIEQKAIEFVKSKYANAEPAPRGFGVDLKIGNKFVEVKGTATNNRKQNIFLSTKPEHAAVKKHGKRYWLYRVVNVGKKNCELHETPAKKLKLKPDPRWRVKIVE